MDDMCARTLVQVFIFLQPFMKYNRKSKDLGLKEDFKQKTLRQYLIISK